MGKIKKPEWWPECPFPEDIFTMTIEEYMRVLPDLKTRTAISGCLGREFWNVASEAIWEKFQEEYAEMKAEINRLTYFLPEGM